MSVNTYLSNLASNLILSDQENESIRVSINTLENRLNSWFGSAIIEKFKFGSYTRNTILPRKVDDESDIDYMIVFDNSDDCTPQTYLNRLKKFVETYYSTSEIHQSSPTIVLKLNHIKFELVPAYKEWSSYFIPDGNGSWMATNPNDFNNKLTTVNNNNSYKIKPIVRLIKNWNVNVNYRMLKSYKIEEQIANNMSYSYYSCTSYTDYLKRAFEEIKKITFNSTIISRIDLAIERIDKAIKYEIDNMPYSALSEIKKVSPEV